MTDITAEKPEQSAPADHEATASWPLIHTTAETEAADPATAMLSAVAPEAADSEATDTEAADSEAADFETADDETADDETADDETADDETADDETADRETADRETADRETADRETADPEAADPEAADPVTAIHETTAPDEAPVSPASQPAAGLVTPFPDSATQHASRGRTTIADEVVQKVAGIAARAVPGVYDLGGDVARVVTAVRERIHMGQESASQGVSVKLENKTAEIDVVIVIEFGFQVYAVADAVRDKVISSVEDMLGLSVTAVNVRIDDVHIPDHGPADADKGLAKD